MPNEVPSHGPQPARVLIVGEAPGEHEEQQGKPFVGPSGYELDKQLATVGISRNDCRVTNVCRIRPPANKIESFFAERKKDITSEHREIYGRWVLPPITTGIEQLRSEIQATRPELVIALGNTALWALTTGTSVGIKKWRGSELVESLTPAGTRLIPTYHPANVLRSWDTRTSVLRDLQRAAGGLYGDGARRPDWAFTTRPSYSDVIRFLDQQLGLADGSAGRILSVDIETSRGHIACIGIAPSVTEAICIPLLADTGAGSYFPLLEEQNIHDRLRRLLTHHNVGVIGQNILYDVQYFWHHLRYVPNVVFDTMVGQHALFSSLPKSLDFLASMYCDYYRYWKDEGKGMGGGNADQWWYYNCLDCVYTLEVYAELCKLTTQMGRWDVQHTQQNLFYPVLRAMQRGVLVDQDRRNSLRSEIKSEIAKRVDFINYVAGFTLKPRSHVQLKKFFYEDLRLPVQLTKAKKGIPGKLTINDAALMELGRIEPLVKPICNAIADIRTLGIFLSNFIDAPLDPDGRMRTSFRIGGSESGESAPTTYRLASAENAFGRGCNLQTVPSDKSKSVNKAKARGSKLRLPNLRDVFIPDPGYTFFNGDLDRADLQVVAWEIDDALLKAALRAGVDIHLLNAFVLDNAKPPPLEELVEGHEAYKEHRLPRSATREFAKTFCHATNYGASARTLAITLQRRIVEIERAQAIWFAAHPGLRPWHRRIEEQVRSKRYVENKFGYRWHIFDRVDGILPEAIAWIPQSTVSNYINRIWQAWDNEIPAVETLIQVHDSLAGQMRTDRCEELADRMSLLAKVVVPYPDPLIIPFSIKYSEKSWGACQ